MDGEWVLARWDVVPSKYKCFILLKRTYDNHFHKHKTIDNIIHTGTWDECVALGKMLGCKFWYGAIATTTTAATSYSWKSIEEPPDEK